MSNIIASLFINCRLENESPLCGCTKLVREKNSIAYQTNLETLSVVLSLQRSASFGRCISSSGKKLINDYANSENIIH